MGQPEAMGVLRPGRGEKRDISILRLLEWAFQRELASIEFDEARAEAMRFHRAIGMEYILMERQKLGCKVDGGGRSLPHPDADTVCAALGAMPEARGGRQMAIRVAELARAGLTPDWMKDATPRCVPVRMHCNRHGWRAKSETCGFYVTVKRGRKVKTESRWCPVTYTPSAAEIASARRRYLDWWCALFELREHFRLFGGLSAWRVTEAMPPRTPWAKNLLTKS